MVHNKVQEPLIACETKENSCKFGVLYNILKWVSIASHHITATQKGSVCVCIVHGMVMKKQDGTWKEEEGGIIYNTG